MLKGTILRVIKKGEGLGYTVTKGQLIVIIRYSSSLTYVVDCIVDNNAGRVQGSYSCMCG